MRRFRAIVYVRLTTPGYHTDGAGLGYGRLTPNLYANSQLYHFNHTFPENVYGVTPPKQS